MWSVLYTKPPFQDVQQTKNPIEKQEEIRLAAAARQPQIIARAISSVYKLLPSRLLPFTRLAAAAPFFNVAGVHAAKSYV